MLRRFIFILSLAAISAGIGAGPAIQAAEQFPYQAVVVGEQPEVRCGPGSKFYVTGNVQLNEQVTVHRHDHGGWYMISPPPGSFSWIDASLVKQLGNGRGQVTIAPGSGLPPRAIVYIGSQISDDHSFYGRELSNGDDVSIQGEQILNGPAGAKKMLKIAPPAQEFRWVKGEFLVPMSRQIQQQLAVDPYQVPAEHRHRHAMMLPTESPGEQRSQRVEVQTHPTEIQVKEAAVPTEPKTSALSAPAPEQTAALTTPPSPPTNNQKDYLRLEEADRRYAEMVRKDPSEWNFDPICNEFEDLTKNGNPHVSQLAQERLVQAVRRRDVSKHYQRIVQVSAETSRRDAQLLAQRAEFQAEPLAAPDAFQAGAEEIVMGEGPAPVPEAMAAGPIAVADAGSSAPLAGVPVPEGVTPRLSGAGILHRVQAPPGFPTYLLTAPDGRMLAYVEPGEGVSLEQWIGKPAGLIGRRSRDENFNADLITVQRVMPVQLSR